MVMPGSLNKLGCEEGFCQCWRAFGFGAKAYVKVGAVMHPRRDFVVQTFWVTFLRLLHTKAIGRSAQDTQARRCYLWFGLRE